MSGFFWTSYVVLWLVLILQAFALLEFTRQIASLRNTLTASGIRADAIPSGSSLPPLVGRRWVDGKAAVWSDYLNSETGALVFLSSRCVSCDALAAELGKTRLGDTNMVVIIQGTRDEVGALVSRAALDPMLVVFDTDGDTADLVGVSSRPAALTVRNGVIGIGGSVQRIDQISMLLEHEQARVEPDNAADLHVVAK